MLFTKRSLLIVLAITISSVLTLSGKLALTNHFGLGMKQCSEIGWGFDGKTKQDIVEIYKKIKENSPGKFVQDFEKGMKPYIDKIGNLTKNITNNIADFAIGDFTTEKLKKLDGVGCDVVPFDEGMKIGVVAVKIGKIAFPCAAPNDLTACFTFTRCGTFSFSFNAGAPKCLVAATGVGAAVAPFLGALSGVGFAYSHNNKIPLKVTISTYSDKETYEQGEFTVKGNIFFTMQFDLAEAIFPENLKIKGKKLSDIFSVKGAGNFIIDYGSLFAGLRDQITGWINGKEQSSLLKKLKNSGAEVAVQARAEMGLKLKELTEEFLPDLDVGSAELNFVASLGQGNSKIPKGVYLGFQATLSIIKSFYDTLLNALGKLLGVFGVQMPEAPKLEASIFFGLTFSDQIIGFRIAGDMGPKNKSINCLYRFADKKFSCKALEVIFTAVKKGATWLVNKVSKFFETVGDQITVAFESAKSWVVTNIVDKAKRWIFTKGTSPPCKADEDKIWGKCYKKDPKRNYYKLYLKTQRMRMMNKKRRLF